MKIKRKGFTLIELLAVIVILGLLMAIAIPSVTKYITESRKKTVTSTIGNYIGALVNDVNDLSYTFTEANTVYAVPIECIALERGGTSPFGEWMQANDSYFAYVLIQYDDETSSYRYGFTFKDSAGYGMYPTTQAKLNEQGKQIQTGLDLSRPETGNVTNITAVENWNGFVVDSTTNLVVLEAESEGNTGDGKTTCTLQQKGDNYATVEDEKQKEKVAYAIYSEEDKSLTFVKSKNEIKAGDIYSGISVTNVFTGFDKESYYSMTYTPWYKIINNVEKVIFKDKIQPTSTKNWFKEFTKCSYFDVANLDVTKVKDMSHMFDSTGISVTTFSIVGLDNWDVSNVTNMSYMFKDAGHRATTFNIGNLSNWNTSNVTNMSKLFSSTGYDATTWSIGDLSNWDTSKVTNMSSMFSNAGRSATTWSIGDLSNWDTSKVTDMSHMFGYAGQNVATVNIGNLSRWDTSNVTDMSSMFSGFRYNATTFTLTDLGIQNWDTSNVTDMSGMFSYAGYNSTTFNLDLSNFDTSKVTDMSRMFILSGRNSTTNNIVGLETFVTSKVTDMSEMFRQAGVSAETYNIGNLSGWDTSNVTDMNLMFYETGYLSSLFKLDCSNWNVDKVTSYGGFNGSVTSKVIAPKWVN